MTDLPDTRHSLLFRLRDTTDREAWRQFVEVYSPVIYHYARRRGLQDADAAERAGGAALGRGGTETPGRLPDARLRARRPAPRDDRTVRLWTLRTLPGIFQRP